MDNITTQQSQVAAGHVADAALQMGTVRAVLTYLSSVSILSVVTTLIAALVIYDQVNYIVKKGSIAGPRFKIWPIMGPFLESVNPKWHEYKAKWESGDLSCVSVFHKFVVITGKTELVRKVLSSPQYASPCVVDVARKIIRPTSFVFMDGKKHLEFRKPLTQLFTRQKLQVYLPAQEKVYQRYFDKFVEITEKEGQHAFMPEFREINCAVSLRAFFGEYVSDGQVKQVADDYYMVTEALELVNFPFLIPGTKAWKGKRVAENVMQMFAECVEKSREYIGQGGSPKCVLDSFIQMIHNTKNGVDNETDGQRPMAVKDFSNYEIATTFFAFLFASQDATSSATTWMFQIIGDRPEVLRKIREEQLAVRSGDLSLPISADMIDQMSYTQMVVKELLRYRPPVPMVPYQVKKPFPITPTYTAPKGAMVVPVLFPCMHDPDVFDDTEEFIPERWAPDQPASKALKSWLVFGTGAHVCLAKTYVMYHLAAMLGKAALFYDWEHHVTPQSEEIRVFATIFPQDSCILSFRKRTEKEILA